MIAPEVARHIPPPAQPDKADVQSLVVYGYVLNCSRHFVLRVKEPARACDFIDGLVKAGYVTYASLGKKAVDRLKDEGRCPVNIGFTYRGLERLGLPKPYLYVFREKARAFAEGAFLRAARRLADTGPSAAQWWERRFNQDLAHVLVTLHADEIDDLKKMTGDLRRIPGADGLKGWNLPLDAKHLDTNRDWRTAHFRVRDGIANPRIRGFHEPANYAPGEFLLGYPNDNSFNPWLLVNPWPLPSPWLLPGARIDPRFFQNGSFAALRKMEQDEKKFRAFVATWAATLNVSEEYVRAKLAGRWDNGSVVRPGETETRPVPKKDTDLNEFDFSKDVDGEGCPFGAHIRRMNPRADPVVPFRRRPLLRRGMPYGPAYADGETPGIKRGLLGLFFCASLEDQFEHLLAECGNANPMGPRNRGSAKDPLIGNHENPGAAFDIPMPEEQSRQLNGLTPFVTTRGALYAFFPGCAALAMIPQLARAKP